MKLIIIHGPPAAGKFTIGTEICRLTGYKLFHNHISIDYVKNIFDFGVPAFWRLIAKVRYETIAEATREALSMVHTFCYELGTDDDHFRRLIAAAEDNGGEVHLVLLRCDETELRNRIGNESRVRIGKLTDPATFDREVKPELSTPLPGRETLIIDTTTTCVEDAAEQIIRRTRLARQMPNG